MHIVKNINMQIKTHVFGSCGRSCEGQPNLWFLKNVYFLNSKIFGAIVTNGSRICAGTASVFAPSVVLAYMRCWAQ